MSTSLIPVDIDAVISDGRWLLGQIMALAGQVGEFDYSTLPREMDIDIPADVEAELEAGLPDGVSLRVTAEEFWRGYFDSAWDEFRGTAGRLNVRLNGGDLDMLDCTISERGGLRRLYEALELWDGVGRPTFNPNGPQEWALYTPGRAFDSIEFALDYLDKWKNVPNGNSPPLDPLTESQQEVYDLIVAEGPVMGREIVNRLGLASESSLTSHMMPALKAHGILNRRGLGYYHPEHYTP